MRRLLTVVLLVALLLPAVLSCRAPDRSAPLTVTFLDVGEGDCTWLRTSAGDILIDAGPENAQESLCRRLRSAGLRRVSLLILTHLDEDHIGGADAILGAFPTDEVWLNGAEDPGESAGRLFSALNASPSTAVRNVRAGDWIGSGDALLTVLCPFPEELPDGGNAGSIVLRVQCGDFSLLMTGDAEETAERRLTERYEAELLRSTVLHVGHHGSDSSSTETFLSAVLPELAVISCGAANRYGHPDGRVLARLAETGCRILRTDLEGDIVLICDGTGYVRAGEGKE